MKKSFKIIGVIIFGLIFICLLFIFFGPQGPDKGLTEFIHINKFLNDPINEIISPHQGPNTDKYSPVFTEEETRKAVEEYNRVHPDNKISPDELEVYLKEMKKRPPVPSSTSIPAN